MLRGPDSLHTESPPRFASLAMFHAQPCSPATRNVRSRRQDAHRPSGSVGPVSPSRRYQQKRPPSQQPALASGATPSANSNPLARSGTDLHHRRHAPDRKSTRLNSSHVEISYAVFCLKKKKDLLLAVGDGAHQTTSR